MRVLVTRYYYSLADVCRIMKNELNWHEKLDEAAGIGMGDAFSTIEADYLLNSTNWSSKDTTENKLLWTKYLWPEYCDANIFYIDVVSGPWEEPEEPEDEDVIEAFGEVAQRMLRWLDESTERYTILLSNLTAIKADLLKQLGSENLTLFNDTPQDGGTDFTTTSYVTNATKVTSKADVATPIARLKEIEEKLHNYYADWADEFMRFVIFSV